MPRTRQRQKFESKRVAMRKHSPPADGNRRSPRLMLAVFQPDADLMGEAPQGFQLHALVAFALFALWPFTRLVHVFSAPLGYLTRPYIVYRSRDDDHLGSHRPRRGWDRVG